LEKHHPRTQRLIALLIQDKKPAHFLQKKIEQTCKQKSFNLNPGWVLPNCQCSRKLNFDYTFDLGDALKLGKLILTPFMQKWKNSKKG